MWELIIKAKLEIEEFQLFSEVIIYSYLGTYVDLLLFQFTTSKTY